MIRWLGALLTMAVLTAFAGLLVTGDYLREGPVLLTLSWSHGVHRGDIGILVGWLLGMVGLGICLVTGRSSRDDV